MKFKTLRECVHFLEGENELIRISEAVDPHLEMAQITRQVFQVKGPALLFENIRGTKFSALSNLFGTFERMLKIFEPQFHQVKALMDILSNIEAFKFSLHTLRTFMPLINSFPLRTKHAKVMSHTAHVTDLPLIQCWPGDGGAFVLLPQVLSMEPASNSIFRSNLGMYRIQLTGNNYVINREVGVHYQLHRGLGVHHKKTLALNRPLPVSIFIGGPPAHTLAAVMPLPEGISELLFAGVLAGRNFRYQKFGDFIVSADADFCILGWLSPGKTKPEGPFGDHLGYYSRRHDYPYLSGVRVFHRPGAIFPFTVVGRPPQEDSNFGKLIHEITGSVVKKSIPGVTAIHAVDHAGVHPLLLAKAHERYIPYEAITPRELLTHANAILGTGQLSLAKYLFIAAHEDNPDLDINNVRAFFVHMLERIDFSRDLHFITKSTIDTLDYSGTALHQGSKMIVAAAGPAIRSLSEYFPKGFSLPSGFHDSRIVCPGIAVLRGPGFTKYDEARKEMNRLTTHFERVGNFDSLPLFVIVDDSAFASKSFADFLWVTFLRSNPSHDIYGLKESIEFKHWACCPPLIIDARIKPFHADFLEEDPEVRDKVKRLAAKGGSLWGIV